MANKNQHEEEKKGKTEYKSIEENKYFHKNNPNKKFINKNKFLTMKWEL